MTINFILSDEQRQLQKDAKEFAERVLRPVAEVIDRAANGWEAFLASREAYREMTRAGFGKSFIPADYGGSPVSLLDLALVAEELTAVDVSTPTTLLTSGIALQPVIRYGTPEQKKRFLQPFAADTDGDLLVGLAFTEVNGGANFDSPDPAGGVQTFARRDGDEWVITGKKHYTGNGTGWDKRPSHLYTTICRTDLTAGADDALAVIMIPGDTPGITVVDVYDMVGHRGAVLPRVHFDEVRVPAANMIAEPGMGKEIFTSAFSWSAAIIGAACVGTMRGAFEYALDFARREKRLGVTPIIEHQSVGYMLADVKMRIEACRYLTWKACHDYEHTGTRAQELPIMTKVYCSETAVAAIYDCMRVVGINSYGKDFTPLERIMRDAMAFPIYDGGNQGVRRRQLHEIIQQPGYDSMLAARGDIPPWA